MLVLLHTFKHKSLRVFSLILLGLLFVACDNKKPPLETNLDLSYDKVPVYSEINTSYPYSFEKFHNVLEQSNYQYPHAETIAQHAAYDTFKSAAFYATQNGDLHFDLTKEQYQVKERSELRQVYKDPLSGEFNTSKGWRTSDNNGNFWLAQVRCYKPKETLAYTWMQVHGIDGVDITLKDGTVVKSFNYPIIRLTWERYRDGVYDHLWAIVITSYPREDKVYEWTDLGPRPNDFFDAEVHFQSNTLKVLIHGNIMLSYDVSYWEEEPSYFKAGLYINRYEDGGEASVAFRNLRFENNASMVKILSEN
jgi:hypothetical protein